MDMLDQALGDSSSQDKNDSNASDDNVQMRADDDDVEESVDDPGVDGATANLLESAGVQYPFRTENGAVTFRVVQVTQGGTAEIGDGAQVITASALAGQQGTTVIPFSNGGGVGNAGSPSVADGGQGTETRFAYFPAVAATADGSSDGNTSAAPTGQFYVMMSPQEVLQAGTQRTIAPRTHQYINKVDGPRLVRDERRRATHNEVERRRRDKINNWIMKLSKIVPDCVQDSAKQGQLITGSASSPLPAQSKGGILAKTCDYINELRVANQRLAEGLKESERMTVEAELLRQQCEELKNENSLLRNQLQQHGVVIVDDTSS